MKRILKSIIGRFNNIWVGAIITSAIFLSINFFSTKEYTDSGSTYYPPPHDTTRNVGVGVKSNFDITKNEMVENYLRFMFFCLTTLVLMSLLLLLIRIGIRVYSTFNFFRTNIVEAELKFNSEQLKNKESKLKSLSLLISNLETNYSNELEKKEALISLPYPSRDSNKLEMAKQIELLNFETKQIKSKMEMLNKFKKPHFLVWQIFIVWIKIFIFPFSLGYFSNYISMLHILDKKTSEGLEKGGSDIKEVNGSSKD